MKKYISFLILLIIPLTVLAKWPSSTSTGTVTKVSDGDTIKVQTSSGIETIRLLWVDTPEKFPTRYGYTECYGEESSHYVESLLPIGTQVYVEFYWNDKYSRDLADVYIGSKTGSLVALEIVKNGYGWVYRKGIKSKPYQSLIRSESLAKKSKIGLWSNDTCGGKRLPAKTISSSSGVIVDPSTVISNPSTSTASVTPNTLSTQLSCSNVPRYCKDVKTREEAQYYLNSCGATRFDRDNDGIACEDIQ